jgi:hypothetical protein
LNDLYFGLRRLLAPHVTGLAERPPHYRAFREGDVRLIFYSCAAWARLSH